MWHDGFSFKHVDNTFVSFLCVYYFRWALLVDDPPCIQTEIRGRESSHWWWPHPCQRVLRALPCKHIIYSVVPEPLVCVCVCVCVYVHNVEVLVREHIRMHICFPWWSKISHGSQSCYHMLHSSHDPLSIKSDKFLFLHECKMASD